MNITGFMQTFLISTALCNPSLSLTSFICMYAFLQVINVDQFLDYKENALVLQLGWTKARKSTLTKARTLWDAHPSESATLIQASTPTDTHPSIVYTHALANKHTNHSRVSAQPRHINIVNAMPQVTPDLSQTTKSVRLLTSSPGGDYLRVTATARQDDGTE